MLNASEAQSKIVPNIQDLIFTQKTIDEMEYENFLSPESVKELKKSGKKANKISIEALRKRKVWMGERLRDTPVGLDNKK